MRLLQMCHRVSAKRVGPNGSHLRTAIKASPCITKKADLCVNDIEPSCSTSGYSGSSLASLLPASVIASMIVAASSCDPASALEIYAEPANALSLPTWAIHVSSVVEWVTAMVRY